jgi:putative sigma-54 modulation protein
MAITISGHHVDLTPALKDYVNEKLSRLERHSDQINSIHVILSVEKLTQKAEATVHLNGGEAHAESVSENMYAAIDLLTDKLDRQVIKHKEKKKKVV